MTSRYQRPLAIALRRWWNAASHVGRLDPWSKEVDEAVRSPEAQPVCSNCLMPQEHHFWFCRECGRPTGEYLTVMPYLQLFVVGEILQRGVVGEPERRGWVTFGFIVISVVEYAFFAPLYWFWMYRRAVGRPICDRGRPELTVEETDEAGDGNTAGAPPAQ